MSSTGMPARFSWIIKNIRLFPFVMIRIQAQDLCKAHSFQLNRAQTDGVEGLLGLREVNYHLFAFVTIKDQFVFPGPFFYLLNCVLDTGMAFSPYDLAQGGVIYKFP